MLFGTHYFLGQFSIECPWICSVIYSAYSVITQMTIGGHMMVISETNIWGELKSQMSILSLTESYVKIEAFALSNELALTSAVMFYFNVSFYGAGVLCLSCYFYDYDTMFYICLYFDIIK